MTHTNDHLFQCILSGDKKALADAFDSDSRNLHVRLSTEEGQGGLLTYAIHHADDDMCLFLIKQKVPTDLRDNYFCTPLLYATWERRHKIVEALLKHGANVFGDYRADISPFLVAARWGDVKTAKLLMEYGADIHRIHLNTHESALDLADYWEYPKMVSFLESIGVARFRDNESGALLDQIRGHVGRVTALDLPMTTVPGVSIRMAVVQHKKVRFKLLFTHGLESPAFPHEIAICVPVEQPVNVNSWFLSSGFAIGNLRRIADLVKAEVITDENHVEFARGGAPDSDQLWPTSLEALALVKYRFTQQIHASADYAPSLLMLTPTSAKIADSPKTLATWREKAAIFPWGKLVVVAGSDDEYLS